MGIVAVTLPEIASAVITFEKILSIRVSEYSGMLLNIWNNGV